MHIRRDPSLMQGLNHAIGEIYDIAFERDSITRTLDLLCRITESQSAIFCHRDFDGSGIEATFGVDPMFDAPMANLMHQNLLAKKMHLVHVDRPVNGNELVPSQEWEGVELYEEVWKPAKLHQCLGVLFARDQEQFSTIGLFRSKATRRHGSRAHEIAAILSPHLRGAMKLRRSFMEHRSRATLMHNALETMSAPIVIVNNLGDLIFANAAAEEILRSKSPLTLLHDRITACSGTDRDRFRRLLASIGQGIGDSAVLGQCNGHPLRLLAAPLNEQRMSDFGFPDTDRLGIVALHTDGASNFVDDTDLQRFFDFTTAEAGLAQAISRGRTLAEIAEARKVSVNTVRTQLKSVFAKSGVTRQADLVRLISSIDRLRLR